MSRPDGPRQGRLSRLRRRAGLDRNPMRRGSDRLHTVIRAGLLVAFVTGAPLAALYAGHGAYAVGMRAVQAAASHRVPAVVMGIRPALRGRLDTGSPCVLVSVWWAVPGAPYQSGQVIMAKNAMTGAVTTVWIGQDGQLAGPPPSRSQVISQARLAAAVAAAGLG